VKLTTGPKLNPVPVGVLLSIQWNFFDLKYVSNIKRGSKQDDFSKIVNMKKVSLFYVSILCFCFATFKWVNESLGGNPINEILSKLNNLKFLDAVLPQLRSYNKNLS